MLQKVFHASAGPLQLLMCASWLSAKLKLIMDMAFLTRLWYYFNTLESALESGGSSDLSTIFQRSIDVNNILILYFQWWNFLPQNLSMILVALFSNDIIVCLDIPSKHSKNSNKILFTSYALHYQILQITLSTSEKSSKDTQISQIRS